MEKQFPKQYKNQPREYILNHQCCGGQYQNNTPFTGNHW
jgi:hypothetical protein